MALWDHWITAIPVLLAAVLATVTFPKAFPLLWFGLIVPMAMAVFVARSVRAVQDELNQAALTTRRD